MKTILKKMSMLVIILLSVTIIWSQEKTSTIPLIGEKAPSFTAKTTNGNLKFPADFGKSWKILFSHPQDFTPVCSSEILELAYLQSEFDRLVVKVAVISTDQLDSHKNWKAALEDLNYKGRDKVKISFPIIEDDKLEVARMYGMIHPTTNSTKTVRGIFVIDPDNVIQSVNFYPMAIGRNMNELLRLVEALQTNAGNGVLTPANWAQGDDVLVPYLPDYKDDKARLEKEGYYSPVWFMNFKKNK